MHQIKDARHLKLNLGCGPQVIDGWVNVDYALGARLTKFPFFQSLNKYFRFFEIDWAQRIYIHNLTRRFPWGDNSVDIVYSSHALEHFLRDEGKTFISECHRVLRKNGTIRIIVPDLSYIVREYSEGKLRANYFVERLGVLYEKSENPIKKRLYPFIQFQHKCMYDSQTLLSLLNEIGFSTINKAPFESKIEDIHRIELKERTEHAVIVEGTKL